MIMRPPSPLKTQVYFGWGRYVHNIEADFIKHRQIIDDTAFLERLPVQVCKHSRDATVAGVVIKDKAGSSPLDRLNGKEISLAVCGDQARLAYSAVGRTRLA